MTHATIAPAGETFALSDAVELVETVRNGFVESRTAGAAVVTGPDGRMLAALGPADALIYPRSTLKPFQAIASLRHGAALAGEALSIACGSHRGTLRHQALAERMLADAGLDASALRCPPAWPADTSEVVAQVRALVDQGVREVVLTGVDLTSWGADLPGAPPLGRLVQRILKLVPDLPRLRLSSIDAAEIDDALLDAFATSERLMPYLHLSLQHGDDLMLKRMKRRHLRADALALVARVRAVRPDVAFGADLIAGFPTESEGAFANLLSLVDEAGLAFVHAFPYSPRPGTPAARMPQLPRPTVKARAAALRQAGERALDRHLRAQVGRTVQALVENGGQARAPDHSPIVFEGAPGALATLILSGVDSARLTATPAVGGNPHAG
ncbi:asparaginase [Brevundimonas sp. UBA7534]|uniref:asparaginase n=1 Tax=Brevundimonas sp. UBA7534 TaxID=1946138 RepID=UPI0025BCB2DE|nr:asparaginase [Brevundimonas sp. UBA7534]